MGIMKKLGLMRKSVQKEREIKVNLFLEEMKKIAMHFMLDIQPILKISENGIQPGLKIVDIPEQPKVIEVKK